MKLFGKKNGSDKIDLNQVAETKNLEVDVIEARTHQITQIMGQATVSVIALAAAASLFILPTTETVKSSAKDILIFLGGGVAGYITTKKSAESKD